MEQISWAFQNPIRSEGAARRHLESVGYETLLILWRRRLLILGLIALAALGAVLVLLFSEREYTSAALVQIDFSRDDQAAPGRAAPAFPVDVSALVESEARLIRSRVIVREVAERLAAGEGGQPVDERGIQQLMRNLTVRNDSRSYLIEIGFSANDPARAALIANLFVETYLRSRSQTTFAAARRAGDWYATQIEETQKGLSAAEGAASDYRAAFGIVEASSEGALQQQQIREVSSQASGATLARMNEEARLDRARRAVAEGNMPPDVAALPQIQRLIESRETARRQVAELVASSGERHPGVERARALQEETEARLREEVGRAVATIAEDAANARKVEGQLEGSAQKARLALIAAKSHEAELRTLQGKADALRARLKTLNESYVQAQALSELRPVAAQVMMAAEPVTAPSGPRASLLLGFSMLGAAVLGTMLSLLLERRDTGFRTEEEVADETGYPCLGLVAKPSGRDRHAQTAARRESVRAIVASLGLAAPQATSKVVLVTSALPGEGKSALVDALALCLAEMGRRVLIMDASPRSETGCDMRPALEDMVADMATRRQFLKSRHVEPLPTQQRRQALLQDSTALVASRSSLSIIQRRTGLAGGAAVFAGSALEDLVKEVCTKFDVVIIEATPVLLVADSLILAQMADIVVHAARWHETSKENVAAALKRLREATVRVRGVVLTQVDMERQRRYGSFLGRSLGRTYRKYYAKFE